MDRLDMMRVFAAVADNGGFALAARRTGLSPPAVTRAVAALEERIGTRLLQRTTRKVRLTEAGLRFLADCKRILTEVEEAEASAAGAHAEPRGRLTLTASVLFGTRYVAPIVLEYLELHPNVTVRLVLLDRIADLMEEGFDVAVRIAHLPDSSLSAVRVGEVRRMVCGSPEYLARRGTPGTPAELSQHDVIAFSAVAPEHPWAFLDKGRVRTVAAPARLLVNTIEVAVAAAMASRGLIQPLSYQVAEELRDGRLIAVLTQHELPPLPVHLVHVEGRRANARLRAFIDLAARRLREASILW